MDTMPPWIISVQHLGELIVRIRFVDVVRDVDLRAVLSADELRALQAEPGLVQQVATRLLWPNGVELEPAMISLIHAGYGARKGWPETAPMPSGDRPFPVPQWVIEGDHPLDHTPAASSAAWRLEQFGHLVRGLATSTEALVAWWAEAQSTLLDELTEDDRRSTVRHGRTAAGMVEHQVRDLLEHLLVTAGVDAVLAADADLVDLVRRATRWNAFWEAAQEEEATAVFDPLTNPDGFREELRARLSASPESPEPTA